MAVLKRRAPADEAVSDLRLVDADAFAEGYPYLHAFLVQCAWDDGTSRAPGSVTLFLDGGRCKGCLSDKDAADVAFVTADGFSEVLRRCDEGLGTESLDWRASRQRKK